jgi:hypothetical protein
VPGQLRWWDGGRWTGQTAPAAAPMPGPGPQAGPPQAGQPQAYPQPGFQQPYAQQPYGSTAPQPYGAPASWAPPAGGWAGPQVYYTPPKKRGRRFWLVTIGVVVVLLAAGGTGLGIVIDKVVRAIAAPIGEANHYLGDLKNGRYASAYSRLCAQDTGQVSLNQFTVSKQQNHPLTYDVTTVDYADKDSVRVATVSFSETSSDGQSGRSTLQLAKTTDGWRVCHFGLPAQQWAGVSGADDQGGGGPVLGTDWAWPDGQATQPDGQATQPDGPATPAPGRATGG